MDTIIIIALAIIAFIVMNSAKIAKDHERYAVFSLGSFQGFKGPGLFFKFPGKDPNWMRISVGDDVKLVAPKIASFNNQKIPVEIDYNTPLDSIVRVIGFTDSAILATRNSSQERKIRCDKCGHEISVK